MTTARYVAVALLLALTASTRAQDTAVSTKIVFLDAEQAAKAVVDESVEPYFKLLQPLEIQAKTGAPAKGDTLEAMRDDARDRYRAFARAFTDQEKQTLAWYVDRLQPALNEHYPKLVDEPWSFLKVSAVMEAGLPHTRSGHIVLSGRLVTVMTQFKAASPDVALAQFGELLLHEQLHVMQRLHPKRFESLYTDVWGFIHVDAIEGGDWLTRMQVVNPDGVDVNWLMPVRNDADKIDHYIWPRLVFKDVQRPRMPVDFRTMGITVNKTAAGYRAVLGDNDEPKMTDLRVVPAFRAKFPRINQPYHPNEIAAEILSGLIIANHFAPAGPVGEQIRQAKTTGRDKEWDWLRKALK